VDYNKVRVLAESVLEETCFAVRAILFDKVAGANWKIPWHQDITIGVRERHETEGYGPWSMIDGAPHVQAPTHILRNMVAIRLHLDDCGPENGPLRVVPGSHLPGRIKKVNIPLMEPDAHSRHLVCKSGDAILMSPLTLHASSPAYSPNHRRVIHIGYAACELDVPLQWAQRV
jgi:ectoine hydroxylase-related dioxygenase (phytanoyl-CoA dioxygenase family)